MTPESACSPSRDTVPLPLFLSIDPCPDIFVVQHVATDAPQPAKEIPESSRFLWGLCWSDLSVGARVCDKRMLLHS
jgi:hypothetical protein